MEHHTTLDICVAAGEADIKSTAHAALTHLKPGGAEGAALFGVLIFCLLPLLIGPCSGLSAEISPVTSSNSPPPAAGSNGAGHISFTSFF